MASTRSSRSRTIINDPVLGSPLKEDLRRLAKRFYFRNMRITTEDVLQMDPHNQIIPLDYLGSTAAIRRVGIWRADFQRCSFGSKFFHDLIKRHYLEYAQSEEGAAFPYDNMGPIALRNFWLRTFTPQNFHRIYGHFKTVIDLNVALIHEEWSPFLRTMWEVASKAIFQYKIAPTLGLEGYETVVNNIRPYAEIRDAPDRYHPDRPGLDQVPLVNQ